MHSQANEGDGLKTILGGMNAERVLIASECIGDARFFVDKAVEYANGRQVFGRAIGTRPPFPHTHMICQNALV